MSDKKTQQEKAHQTVKGTPEQKAAKAEREAREAQQAERGRLIRKHFTLRGE